MGWEKRPPGLYDGEVLLLIDAETPWSDVGRLYMHCAEARIWRLGFVSQKPSGERTFLPLPIPSEL